MTTRRSELQQVLLNLVLNARSAVLENSGPRQITISAGRRSRCVAVCVRDNGVGIRPEDIERIFEPFFTTRHSPDEAKGHGLGLTFCRDVVAAMDGSISVESTPGEGTAFTVRLPG